MAHEQLDALVDLGVNFIDSAELYPEKSQSWDVSYAKPETKSKFAPEKNGYPKRKLPSKTTNHPGAVSWFEGVYVLKLNWIGLQISWSSVKPTGFGREENLHWPKIRPLRIWLRLTFRREVDDWFNQKKTGPIGGTHVVRRKMFSSRPFPLRPDLRRNCLFVIHTARGLRCETNLFLFHATLLAKLRCSAPFQQFIYLYNTYFHPENSGRLLFFATVILFRKLENHILSFYTSSLFFPGCEKAVLFFFPTSPILLFHCGSLVFHRGWGILYPLRDACGPKNGSAHGWTKQWRTGKFNERSVLTTWEPWWC